jgi:hypothetical protein
MARSVRVTLDANITRDDFGIEAAVRVGQLPRKRRRWPLATWDTAAGRATVRAWVTSTRADLEAELRAFGTPVRVARGTLEAAGTEWKSRLNVRPGAAADVSHMRAWLLATPPGSSTPLGQWQVQDITTKEIDQIIRLWQTAPTETAIRQVRVQGFARRRNGGAEQPVRDYVRTAPATSGAVASARTIKHRVRVFVDVWRTTQGTRTTPADDAKVPKLPTSTPTPIAEDLLRAVLVKLATIDPVTYARYAIVTSCWQRPVAVSRAQPGDVDLGAGRWTIRSQKGAPSHSIDLGPAAVAAWRLFISLNAWGVIDTTHYGNQIHKAGLPHGTRPYNARHSGAINALLEGISLEKVANQLGNDIATARRFYTGHVPDPTREIAVKTGDRFLDLFTPRLVKKR